MISLLDFINANVQYAEHAAKWVFAGKLYAREGQAKKAAREAWHKDAKQFADEMAQTVINQRKGD